jgi:hypothetical protein
LDFPFFDHEFPASQSPIFNLHLQRLGQEEAGRFRGAATVHAVCRQILQILAHLGRDGDGHADRFEAVSGTCHELKPGINGIKTEFRPNGNFESTSNGIFMGIKPALLLSYVNHLIKNESLG